MKRIAKRLKLSEQKVRKILITLGQYTTPTISSVNIAYKNGQTIEQISGQQNITTKSVRSMLPYTKGQYMAEYPTINALRVRASKAKKRGQK